MRMGNRVARLVRQAGSGQSARGLVSLRADSATSSDWGKSKPGQPCQGGQADSDHSHMREEMIHEKHENEHATMHQNSDEPTLSSHGGSRDWLTSLTKEGDLHPVAVNLLEHQADHADQRSSVAALTVFVRYWRAVATRRPAVEITCTTPASTHGSKLYPEPSKVTSVKLVEIERRFEVAMGMPPSVVVLGRDVHMIKGSPVP
jgi:hypothetical protein